MNEQKDEYLLLHNISWRENLTAIILFAAVLAVQRIELLSDPMLYFLGGSHADAGLYLWLFRHHLYFLFELPLFETTAFFPYPLTLAWSDNFILPALLAFPLYLLGIPIELLYNGILLLAHLLTAYCTFRLTLLLTGQNVAALVSGSMPLLLSYFTSSLGHPQLAFAFCFPLGIEILLRSFRSPIRWGMAYGLLILGTFLTTVYYAIFLAVLPLVLFGAHIILRPLPFSYKLPIRFALGGIITAPLLLIFAMPYMQIKEVFGSRALDEMAAFGSEGASFFSAPPLSALYGFTSPLSHAEAYFFPGIFLLMLIIRPIQWLTNAGPLRRYRLAALVTFVLLILSSSFRGLSLAGASDETVLFLRQYLVPLLTFAVPITFGVLLYQIGKLERCLRCSFITNRALIAFIVSIALFFFILSLGPIGRSSKGELQWGAFALFYNLFPGFDSVRAISRAAIPALLMLPVLAGFSIAAYCKKAQGPLWLPFLLLPILAVENHLNAYSLEPRDGAPAVLQHLEEIQQPGDVTVFIPWTDEIKSNGTVKSWKNFATRNVDYMNWSLDHSLLTVNGYSGQRTKIMKELPGALAKFPDEQSVAALSQIANLSYVIYAPRFINSFDETHFEDELKRFAQDFQFVQRDAEGFYLLRFTGETRVSDRTTIRAAQHWPNAQFSIQLKAQYEPHSPDMLVDILELDHWEAEKQFTAAIPQDGKWHSISFSLPESKEAGRPFRFSLQSNGSIRFFFRQARVQQVESTPDD